MLPRKLKMKLTEIFKSITKPGELVMIPTNGLTVKEDGKYTTVRPPYRKELDMSVENGLGCLFDRNGNCWVGPVSSPAFDKWRHVLSHKFIVPLAGTPDVELFSYCIGEPVI